MRDAHHDDATGALLLTTPLAKRLLPSWPGGAAPVSGEPLRGVLSSVELAGDGELAARVRCALAAVVHAIATVDVAVSVRRQRGWLSDEALVLTVDREPGWLELICTPVDFFAGTVARLVGVGPRPTRGVDDGPSAPRAAWVVEAVAAPADAAGARRSLQVVDTDADLWRVQQQPSGVDAVPLATEVLWRELSGMPARRAA